MRKLDLHSVSAVTVLRDPERVHHSVSNSSRLARAQVARIVTPSPGADSIANSPLVASTRPRIVVQPPAAIGFGLARVGGSSKPTPSSLISSVSRPSVTNTQTRALSAYECFGNVVQGFLNDAVDRKLDDVWHSPIRRRGFRRPAANRSHPTGARRRCPAAQHTSRNHPAWMVPGCWKSAGSRSIKVTGLIDDALQHREIQVRM